MSPRQKHILSELKGDSDSVGKSISAFKLDKADEEQLARFKEWLDTQWGPPAVEIFVGQALSGGVLSLPRITSWDVPSDFPFSRLVFEQVHTESFIDEMWPIAKIMLKNDVLNSMWVAHMMTLLAMFNLITLLPIIKERQ